MKRILFTLAITMMTFVSCTQEEFEYDSPSNQELVLDRIGNLDGITTNNITGTWTQVDHFQTDRYQNTVASGLNGIGSVVSFTVENSDTFEGVMDMGDAGSVYFRVWDENPQVFLPRMQFSVDGNYDEATLANTQASFFTKDGKLHLVESLPNLGGYIHRVYER